jgi:hypothetical protein
MDGGNLCTVQSHDFHQTHLDVDCPLAFYHGLHVRPNRHSGIVKIKVGNEYVAGLIGAVVACQEFDICVELVSDAFVRRQFWVLRDRVADDSLW